MMQQFVIVNITLKKGLVKSHKRRSNKTFRIKEEIGIYF